MPTSSTPIPDDRWFEQWTLGSATRPGAADASTVALVGRTIYHEQEVEVVSKLEAEQLAADLREERAQAVAGVDHVLGEKADLEKRIAQAREEMKSRAATARHVGVDAEATAYEEAAKLLAATPGTSASAPALAALLGKALPFLPTSLQDRALAALGDYVEPASSDQKGRK